MFLSLIVGSFNIRNVQRRRQVIDDSVQHRLNALVFERRSADYREDLQGDGRLANAGLDFLDRERCAFNELLEQLVVEFRNGFDHLFAVVLRLFDELLRNVHHIELCAQRFVVPDNGLHFHQIDNALELVFRADRDLNRDRTRAQAVNNRVYRMKEIRADAVHLVDEADARNRVFVGLTPDGFRLRLHAGDGIENSHSAIEHAQRPFDFSGEVDVPGRVDDVDLHVLPGSCGRGGRNRNAALLFLFHPVHGGGAFMHFTDLVRAPRVIQDAFRGCGFTGIDMSSDADISHPLEGYSACHGAGLPLPF